ncbi:MAG: hypothetical protein LZF85_07980 [Nitrosomonas sp.]|uniref:hypothetical protein n=1 Tax=Nitrosomonas sp. TaxID=42353 RepID=UPI001A444BF7|nr:hypothetical protein [Nitrosomonas sp.]MBL8500468.1 hypothetical protein [Nitrosomonas sp.]UJP01737.1 MAG: hypothetical protein LZF85_07980 [Nitrosomonas sp.]
MANKDFTAVGNATPEQLEKQYPCNGDPFGVWYCIDAERYRWAVNDKKGHAFTETLEYKTALIISEALRIRHKKINNGLLLGAKQKKVIADALLIGLESYGEIERIDNAVSMADVSTNGCLPDSIRPIHPTGSADTIGVFAAALRYMQPT